MSPPPPSSPRRPPPISMQELSEEPRSGSWQIPVSLGDLKAFRTEARTELKKEITRHEGITSLGILLGCLGTLMSAWFFIMREARAQADAGVSAVAIQAKATQA